GPTLPSAQPNSSDRAWYPAAAPPPQFRKVARSSRYLTMRDGVKVAVDIYLPRELGASEKIPAILRQTRYCRSMELRWPFRALVGGQPIDHTGQYAAWRRRFVQQGYAWIDVDVRGSGASYGKRIADWSPDEVRDGGEIVQWIVSQPWSSGKVGAL